MRLFVFRIYPNVVSDRLDLDIGDIVVGHFLLDGFDMLDQPVWAPDCGHGGGDTTARVNSDGKFEKYRRRFDSSTTENCVITPWSQPHGGPVPPARAGEADGGVVRERRTASIRAAVLELRQG
jgi:hypothetical protein